MECFIMHRKGVFEPSYHTPNQCKVQGHESYKYHMIMVFPANQQLDANAFILDHQDVDDTIQKMILKGSCEQMQQKICDKMKKYFSKRKIELLAMKTILKPVVQGEGVAHMEYLYTKDSAYIPLISQMV